MHISKTGRQGVPDVVRGSAYQDESLQFCQRSGPLVSSERVRPAGAWLRNQHEDPAMCFGIADWNVRQQSTPIVSISLHRHGFPRPQAWQPDVFRYENDMTNSPGKCAGVED
jgi:hypothetical protein